MIFTALATLLLCTSGVLLAQQPQETSATAFIVISEGQASWVLNESAIELNQGGLLNGEALCPAAAYRATAVTGPNGAVASV